MPETSISFWGYWGERCDPKNSVGSTLERWLHDPKVAECLNRTIPTDAVDIPGGRGTISFGVTFVEENGLVYPGGINADELSKTSISKFERRPAILLKDPTVKGDCLFRTPDTPDKSGYELHRIGNSPEYTLNATARLGRASRPLCVGCGEISVISCAVHLTSGDRAVGVRLGWDPGEHARSTAGVARL